MKCPACKGKLVYKEIGKQKNKKTHMWVCENCPIVIIEFWEDKDVNNLSQYLKRT